MKVKISGNNGIAKSVLLPNRRAAQKRLLVEVAKLEKKGCIVLNKIVEPQLGGFSYWAKLFYVPKGKYEVVDDSVEVGVYLK